MRLNIETSPFHHSGDKIRPSKCVGLASKEFLGTFLAFEGFFF